MWVQLCAFEAPGVFQIMWYKHGSAVSMEKWSRIVKTKLSTSYFIFYGRIALMAN